MPKEIHYSNADGTYSDRAYHRHYEAQHQDRRALWRLNAALNECVKYPTIMGEATQRCHDFYVQHTMTD